MSRKRKSAAVYMPGIHNACQNEETGANTFGAACFGLICIYNMISNA